MSGLAPDHAAEGDDARVAARLGERHRPERELECPRHGHHGHRLAAHADRVELGERRFEQPVGHVAVEPCGDDADPPAGRARLALEEVDVVGDGQRARRMAREAQAGLAVVELVRLVVVELVGLLGLVVVVAELVGLVGLVVIVAERIAPDGVACHVRVTTDRLVVVVVLLAGPGLGCAHSSSASNFSP